MKLKNLEENFKPQNPIGFFGEGKFIPFPKWIKMLDYLYTSNETYALVLSKDLNITYSHVIKVLNEFVVSGMLRRKLLGRTVLLQLTPFGIKKAKLLHDFLNMEDIKKNEKIKSKTKVKSSIKGRKKRIKKKKIQKRC